MNHAIPNIPEFVDLANQAIALYRNDASLSFEERHALMFDAGGLVERAQKCNIKMVVISESYAPQSRLEAQALAFVSAATEIPGVHQTHRGVAIAGEGEIYFIVGEFRNGKFALEAYTPQPVTRLSTIKEWQKSIAYTHGLQDVIITNYIFLRRGFPTEVNSDSL